MVLRAMDDIKESCREAAVGAMRSLRSVTLRLADPSATQAPEASEAISLMLPFLLDKGEHPWRIFAHRHSRIRYDCSGSCCIFSLHGGNGFYKNKEWFCFAATERGTDIPHEIITTTCACFC